MVLYCIIWYYITFYCFILYYIILNYIILYYIILFDAGVVRCRSSLAVKDRLPCAELARSLRDSGAKKMHNFAGTGRSQNWAAHSNHVVRRLMQGMRFLTSKAYVYTYVYTYVCVRMHVCIALREACAKKKFPCAKLAPCSVLIMFCDTLSIRMTIPR